jgi:hypothetical protein
MAFMDVAPTGTPNGRVVVLLHGKNFDSSYWSGAIGALTAAGFRRVVPDQIGFNKSSKAGLEYSFDSLAANTTRLLDSLNVRDVDVVGHSTWVCRRPRAYLSGSIEPPGVETQGSVRRDALAAGVIRESKPAATVGPGACDLRGIRGFPDRRCRPCRRQDCRRPAMEKIGQGAEFVPRVRG